MTDPSGEVYLLEDDVDVADVFSRQLEQDGFSVRVCPTVASFASAAKNRAPTLAVIDLGLPDGDGLALLGGILTDLDIPCIVVTGRGALNDRLDALDRGADDYLVKPIDPRELVARVRAVLRRSESAKRPDRQEPATTVASFAGWRADFGKLMLTGPDGKTAPLSQADAVLLKVLLDAPGRVLSRDYLLDACDVGDEELFDRSIDVRISRLRKKLRDSPQSPAHIRTVYGAGYVFASPVVWEDPAA